MMTDMLIAAGNLSMALRSKIVVKATGFGFGQSAQILVFPSANYMYAAICYIFLGPHLFIGKISKNAYLTELVSEDL